MSISQQPYTVKSTAKILDQLYELKQQFESKHLTELFQQDPQRFQHFSVNLEPLP